MINNPELSELKEFIREIIDEEFGPKPVPMAQRWEGGKLVLTPGNDSQAKEVPLDIFFKKILTIRDALRVLEQKINSHDNLNQTDKATMHSYITKAYGTLTTFNILFRDDKERFVGSGGHAKEDDAPKMTIAEARKKIGLNEY